MDDDFDYGDDVVSQSACWHGYMPRKQFNRALMLQYERSGLQKEPQSATPSLKGRSTITVQNQPHDEVSDFCRIIWTYEHGLKLSMPGEYNCPQGTLQTMLCKLLTLFIPPAGGCTK
eukprot:GHRR01030797.1.p1 GENE.GHRR01030797.1~~GHRR01030797.1.p1  ORF type:complete len:132 (-),score=13.91 GHRR01030797.1:552-902(-)